MAYFTGRNGRLFVDQNAIAKVTSWTIKADLDLLETTTLGDSNKTFVPDLPTYTGSAAILYNRNDANNNIETAAIFNRLLARSASLATATLRLQILDGATPREVIVTAYITSISIGASVGDIVSADINFQATGNLLDPTAQQVPGIAL